MKRLLRWAEAIILLAAIGVVLGFFWKALHL